jgi:hypothetical protein
MTRFGWYRLRWGFLLVGVTFFVSCVAQFEPVERRAGYGRAPQRYGAPQPEEPHAYLSQFGDIPIPGELSEVSEHTTVVETRGAKTGFIVYSGRVMKTSVEVFFRGELKKKGWDLVTAFASQPSTVLLFNKKTRWCVITLDVRGPATDVRIGVSQDLGLAPRLLGH